MNKSLRHECIVLLLVQTVYLRLKTVVIVYSTLEINPYEYTPQTSTPTLITTHGGNLEMVLGAQFVN